MSGMGNEGGETAYEGSVAKKSGRVVGRAWLQGRRDGREGNEDNGSQMHV